MLRLQFRKVQRRRPHGFRAAAVIVEQLHKRPAHAVEFAEGNVALPLDAIVECGELVIAVAETGKLRVQGFGAQRMFFRGAERSCGLNFDVVRAEQQRETDATFHHQMEIGFDRRQFRILPCLAEFRFQFRIGCFPDFLSGMNTFPINRRKGFVKIDALVFDLPDPPALLVVAIFSGIEDHAVASLQR